ncbi:lysophospholipase L1-like esterase [Saccharopolyspora lacisalsi]|uniref:Lysophospholipase L1-like esterase n=1 Tax=Halosaccharopolyspora lacisalsi TaxID=1000566 RepID=A0A839DYC5_9PSEU|nr:SGNH/GDSL hydrolase family protein [Halosaccharopolyspora lacisalsi]MBA8825729.1 lysophospholipase L1-like esterase [Halosaccharopolyspora lacisalsi]
MNRTRLSACVSAVLASALLPLAAPSAGGTTETLEYVALGDSYASGVGIGEYYPESGDCKRSPKAYPALAADRSGVDDFGFAACGGAVTTDVRTEQLDALSSGTDVVTVSVGGNDAGFASVVTSCVIGPDKSCDMAVDQAETFATGQLPGLLTDTYAAIAEAAPKAEVIAVGYPRLFELGSCETVLSEFERQRLNDAADTLDEVIEQQARAAGFVFTGVRDSFAGHGACGAQPWINGLTSPISESFHPNAMGHARGYLPEVTDSIRQVVSERDQSSLAS